MAKIDTQLVHLKVPKILLKEVEDYQIKKGLTITTSAVLVLIRQGLKIK